MIEHLLNLETWQIIVVFCIVFAIVSILLISVIITNRPKQAWKNIIFPVREAVVDSEADEFVTKSKIRRKVKKQLDEVAKKSKFDVKIADLYTQAGMAGKTYEDFVWNNLKFVAIGVLLGVAIYILFGNILIALLFGAIFCFLHIIEIYGTISDRKKEFTNDFPFFLKTLSFILANGSNMNTAFKRVIDNTKEGVLKQVMTEVLEIEKINGGNFAEAFSILPKRINSDETREFANIVQNNFEKGIPIAETLSNQSETLSKFLSNKQLKKVKNIDNKMMIPLLCIFGAVFLLLYAGGVFSFGG